MVQVQIRNGAMFIFAAQSSAESGEIMIGSTLLLSASQSAVGLGCHLGMSTGSHVRDRVRLLK